MSRMNQDSVLHGKMSPLFSKSQPLVNSTIQGYGNLLRLHISEMVLILPFVNTTKLIRGHEGVFFKVRKFPDPFLPRQWGFDLPC